MTTRASSGGRDPPPGAEELSWQLHLFRLGQLTCQFFVTNLPRARLSQWRFHNGRSRVERLSRQRKEASVLGRIPMGDFAADQAVFHLAPFAGKCLDGFRRFCVPPPLDRATLQQLRQHPFVVPAVLVQPQGQPTLRLAAGSPDRETFPDILRRISRFHRPRGEQPCSRRIRTHRYVLALEGIHERRL